MTADERDDALPGLVRATARKSGAAARARRAKQAAPVALAEVDPVARVLVDLPLAHLDRTFDYAVPASMGDQAVPGVRVKVRFAGQDVDGFVVERAGVSEHDGQLAPLRRVVSAEPVLTPAIAELCRRIAERYAGVSSDVRRLALPPRHATTEKQPSSPEPPFEDRPVEGDQLWAAYPAAAAFRRHLMTGGAPRAVWSAAPGEDWPRRLAELASATRLNGRGVLICVPDHRDVARVDAALMELMGPDHHVTLQAEAGPGPRYRDFLMVSRGARRIVVGTRSAAFAPVHDLGLVVVWDDGDDLHAEPRAPYPHAREVLLERAEIEGCAALVGGFSRSVEADHLLQTGWAKEIAAPRPTVRDRALIGVTGADHHDPYAAASRVPTEAHDAVRWGLERGPVLVQTPRAGYVLRLACERCRTPARCSACSGPLQLTGPTTPPRCRWCATEAPGWACVECGGRGLRAPVIGDARTADELGRAFAPVPVVTSSGDHVRAEVDGERRIVVATPGAEPVAADGYAVVVLLDTWLLLLRDSMRAAEEALRRWSNAVALLRPGGRALAVGEPAVPALQALVRWDQAGFAGREAAERREARLPPATRVATLRGEPGALDDALTLLDLPEGADVLGPMAPSPGAAGGSEGEERAVVRVPRAHGAALSAALGELQRVRSARKLDPVRIQVDPGELF